MPKNALAPQPSNRLVDYFVQNAPADKFPTAGRVYLESMQGKKNDITEADFSKEELAAIKQLIMSTNNRGSVQYRDYKPLMDKSPGIPASYLPSVTSMLDPLGNIQTTLGRFKYVRDPDGTLRAVDTYDFNPVNTPNADAMLAEANTGALGPYNMLRVYAGQKLPPGTGRRVNINLGK